MKIRQATPQDAGAIADLWNNMITGSLVTFTTRPKTQEDMETMILARTAAFWVADEGAVLGFVTFGPFRSGPGYAATVEHTIVLDERAQGRGMGRNLMHTAITGAEALGHRVMVAAISSANPGAVAFHTALGFTQTGHMPQVGRKQGQWLDLILMQKTLTTP